MWIKTFIYLKNLKYLKKLLKVNNLFELTRTIFEEETYMKMTDTFNTMTTNFVIVYLFKMSYLKHNWITISIPWYDFCFSNATSILGYLERGLDEINIDCVSELIDDIDEDEIGSSKSIALSSLSVSD